MGPCTKPRADKTKSESGAKYVGPARRLANLKIVTDLIPKCNYLWSALAAECPRCFENPPMYFFPARFDIILAKNLDKQILNPRGSKMLLSSIFNLFLFILATYTM